VLFYNVSEPVALALLFADRLITENTNKKGIIGTFDRFMSPSFPVVFPPWGLYVAVTNLEGRHGFTIELECIETGQIVLPIKGEIESPDTDNVVELTFNVAGIMFPTSGRYNLAFEIDGELVASRIIKVDLVQTVTG